MHHGATTVAEVLKEGAELTARMVLGCLHLGRAGLSLTEGSPDE